MYCGATIILTALINVDLPNRQVATLSCAETQASLQRATGYHMLRTEYQLDLIGFRKVRMKVR
jgi:hypothetical protein